MIRRVLKASEHAGIISNHIMYSEYDVAIYRNTNGGFPWVSIKYHLQFTSETEYSDRFHK